jgi:hypothetical protein
LAIYRRILPFDGILLICFVTGRLINSSRFMKARGEFVCPEMEVVSLFTTAPAGFHGALFSSVARKSHFTFFPFPRG